MAKISVNYTACVHSRSIAAGCVKCENECGFDAIKINGQLFEFYPDKCTICLECIPVCPTSAISSPSADVLGFVSDFLDSQDDTISIVNSGFSPVALDEQTLLTLLFLKKSYIKIDATPNNIHKKIESKIEKTNIYADALGIKTRVLLSTEGLAPNLTEPNRRSFFRSFNSKNLLSVARELNEQSKEPVESVVYAPSMIDYNELRQKTLPPSREGFLSVIKTMSINPDSNVPPLFSTDKLIDNTCTNCELCYNLCPTGALSSTRLKNGINFESYKCLKCSLCEDVCETKSIYSMPSVNLAAFATQAKKELIKFSVIRCDSCGVIFAPMSESIVCPRCSKEDEDAMELSGLF